MHATLQNYFLIVTPFSLLSVAITIGLSIKFDKKPKIKYSPILIKTLLTSCSKIAFFNSIFKKDNVYLCYRIDNWLNSYYGRTRKKILRRNTFNEAIQSD